MGLTKRIATSIQEETIQTENYKQGVRMNRMPRYGIYIFISVLIIGCTPLATRVENINQEVVGKNIDIIFTDWGVPSSSVPLSNAKGTVYEWDNGGCKNLITTDEKGINVSYNAIGNCSQFPF